MSDASREPINPYAAPETMSLPCEVFAEGDTSADEIRRAFLPREREIRLWGQFLCVSAGVFLLLALLMSAITIHPQAGQMIRLMSVYPLVLAVLSGGTGIRMRQLNSRTRLIEIMFITAVFAIPVWGTLVSGYTSFLLFTAKGRFVFTQEYAAVITSTPHQCPTASWSDRVVFGMLLLLQFFFVACVVAATCYRRMS